ncbi:MAG: hypothetical protein HY518_00050 [Candidatus Aenigmarchaeota archaeon]|nr:hypothetical protein [Candidatus Aenigmarchaeota archaeon]
MAQDLESAKKEIIRFCEGGPDIFYSQQISDKENSILWAGKDFREFLLLAKKLAANPLYFYERKFAGTGAHEGQLVSIEVGFLHSGIFHYFTVMPEWFGGGEPGAIQLDEEIPKEIAGKSVEELASGMMSFISRKYKQLSELKGDIGSSQKRFWSEMGFIRPNDLEGVDPEVRSKIEAVEHRVERHFTALIRKEEQKLIPKLAAECASWHADRGLKDVLKSNIDTFLLDRDVVLTAAGEEALVAMVGTELRKR